MSHNVPPDAILVIVPTIWLIFFDVLLFVCGIGMAIEISMTLWQRKRAKQQENIYTSNSDLSQEETQRVTAIKRTY